MAEDRSLHIHTDHLRAVERAASRNVPHAGLDINYNFHTRAQETDLQAQGN